MKADGTKGYAARETYESESTYKLYLVPLTEEEETTDEDGSTTIKNDKVKIDTETNDVTAVPGATGNDFAQLLSSEVVVKNASGELMALDAKLGTGCTINDTYTISVLGDVNGDAEINSGDLFYTQKYLLKQTKFEEFIMKACDVNKDNEINSGDLFFLQKYLLKKTDFSV